MKEMLKSPGSFSASQGEIEGEIHLQWDSVNNANGYIVEYCIKSKRMNWKQVDFVPVSRCIIAGNKLNKTYYFRVAAVNSDSQGPWSSVIEKRITG